MDKKYEYNSPLVYQRADPFVYLHTDGYYYFTGTMPQYDCIEIRRAKTLNGLLTADSGSSTSLYRRCVVYLFHRR